MEFEPANRFSANRTLAARFISQPLLSILSRYNNL
jgi:hypothetical protein